MFSYEKYEIRLESIGGLGANLVGKLLGQLGAESVSYTHLLCVPGVSFGKEGEGYVRMALVQSVENLEKAIENIKNSGILEK